MGVKEKKEINAINEYLDAEGLGLLKEASANAGIEFDLQIEESLDAGQISIVGVSVKEFVEGFVSTCKDQDYKEEIAKLSKITLESKSELEKNKDLLIFAHAKLENDQLIISVNGKHAISNGDSAKVVELIQSVY